MSAVAFDGFRPEAIQFLADLAANNDRSWFQPRKADYERLLKVPMEALCVALAERFAARAVPLTADPARSPFRIYRDVRFSKDKSPYKTYVSASFPWAGDGGRGATASSSDGLDATPSTGATAGGSAGEMAHGPGGYFHLQPGMVYAGGGMWHPAAERLAAWRALVDAEPRRVHVVIEEPAFVAEFGSLDGEQLKRVPPGFPKDHPDAELLRFKDLTFGRRLSDAEALSPELPDILVDSFRVATPLLRMLASLDAPS